MHPIPHTHDIHHNDNPNALPKPEPVVLLHGLHMHAPAMRPLAGRLNKLGFDSQVFGYFSMLHPVATHSHRLNQWLTARFADTRQPVHLVGHSLGGLVIRDFLHRYPHWLENGKIGRVVTIGTPHNGSLSADNIVRFLPTFIGKSYLGALDGTTPSLDDGIELGVIAGDKSAGLGRVIMPKTHKMLPNDGTVWLAETLLPQACDHITLPHSHTGLIFSPAVAEQVAYFLWHGCFKK